jgi:hypothetical protein
MNLEDENILEETEEKEEEAVEDKKKEEPENKGNLPDALKERKARLAAEQKLTALEKKFKEMRKSTMTAEELNRETAEEAARLQAELLKTKTMSAATKELSKAGFEIDDDLEEILDALRVDSVEQAQIFALSLAQFLNKVREQGKSEQMKENADRMPSNRSGVFMGEEGKSASDIGKELANKAAAARGYIQKP